ncbi:S8 family serine peptidase [Mycoplasmopsis agalactiae]|uniref:S8 family serine peptidase n=1 Tax=Mycoplasmopsis agalactiae TaxID=2110 RepID=UPI00211B87AC|nr:S8 family serine peptidase [Mycoplasmopsis agalactiae]UUM25687.1 S8 family serine peptidase [Mycoplasmopsis agalactiae]
MKRLNKLILTPILFAPFFSVSAVLPATNSQVKLNKDSSELINWDDYKHLVKMYTPYYSKLGVWDREWVPTSYSSNKYDKVGIIEVDDFDDNYLLSQNSDFLFKKTNSNSTYKKGNHGYAVTSIIGTDFGINPNASIYYEASENLLKSVKNLHNNYGIKLINMSLGPVDPYYQVKKAVQKLNSNDIGTKYYDFDGKIKISHKNIKELLHSFKILAKTIIYYTYRENKQIYGASDTQNFYKAIGEYALENDIKIIQSSGNSNDEVSEYMANNDFLNKPQFLEDGRISKNKIYRAFKSFFNLAQNWQSDLWPNEDERNNNINLIYVIRVILDKAFDDIWWIYKDENTNWLRKFNFDAFLDVDFRKSTLFDAITDWQSTRYHEGIISVGAVNWKNIVTNFSSYAKNRHGSYPLISAYGDTLMNDKAGLLKSYYHRNNYSEIEKYIESPKNNKEFKNKMSYMINFNGTSKSAPMITGIISRLQSKLQQELSIEDVKLMLASSATYSKTKASWYSSSSFDRITSPYEYWRWNNAKNKTGFGVPKYFKMKEIWDSKNIRRVRPHEIGKNFISSTGVLQIYDSANITKKWKYWTSTFVWKQKKSFAEYWRLYELNNNPYISWFRNKWLPLLLKAIEYKKSKDPDWNFSDIPIYAIETDMHSSKNSITRDVILYSQEPHTSVQHVYFYKKDPDATYSYSTYIKYAELEKYLILLLEYLAYKDNINLNDNKVKDLHYYLRHPLLEKYENYVTEMNWKYWEHLKENVWLESFTNLF